MENQHTTTTFQPTTARNQVAGGVDWTPRAANPRIRHFPSVQQLSSKLQNTLGTADIKRPAVPFSPPPPPPPANVDQLIRLVRRGPLSCQAHKQTATSCPPPSVAAQNEYGKRPVQSPVYSRAKRATWLRDTLGEEGLVQPMSSAHYQNMQHDLCSSPLDAQQFVEQNSYGVVHFQSGAQGDLRDLPINRRLFGVPAAEHTACILPAQEPSKQPPSTSQTMGSLDGLHKLTIHNTFPMHEQTSTSVPLIKIEPYDVQAPPLTNWPPAPNSTRSFSQPNLGAFPISIPIPKHVSAPQTLSPRVKCPLWYKPGLTDVFAHWIAASNAVQPYREHLMPWSKPLTSVRIRSVDLAAVQGRVWGMPGVEPQEGTYTSMFSMGGGDRKVLPLAEMFLAEVDTRVMIGDDASRYPFPVLDGLWTILSCVQRVPNHSSSFGVAATTNGSLTIAFPSSCITRASAEPFNPQTQYQPSQYHGDRHGALIPQIITSLSFDQSGSLPLIEATLESPLLLLKLNRWVHAFAQGQAVLKLSIDVDEVGFKEPSETYLPTCLMNAGRVAWDLVNFGGGGCNGNKSGARVMNGMNGTTTVQSSFHDNILHTSLPRDKWNILPIVQTYVSRTAPAPAFHPPSSSPTSHRLENHSSDEEMHDITSDTDLQMNDAEEEEGGDHWSSCSESDGVILPEDYDADDEGGLKRLH